MNTPPTYYSLSHLDWWSYAWAKLGHWIAHMPEPTVTVLEWRCEEWRRWVRHGETWDCFHVCSPQMAPPVLR